jgi:hypothetical protein
MWNLELLDIEESDLEALCWTGHRLRYVNCKELEGCKKQSRRM